MKRSYKLLFALAAVVLMMLASGTALADTYRFGTVANSSSVNLRAGASKSTQKLGSYKRDTWLRILGDYGDWYRVKGPDGKTGYMMKDYIYISAGAKGIVGIVDANDGLNLRATASSSGKVTGVYPDGVPCILLSETGNWYHVNVDGKAGYFSADYIDKKYMAYSQDVATVVNPNGKSVNLRKGPGTDYSVVKSVKNGSYVMIIQEGDGWWKISVDGSVGYMMTDYLKDGIVGKSSGSSAAGNNNSSAGGTGYALVDTGRLHLRQSASKSSRSLGTFPRNSFVNILERGSTWCKVQVDGQNGYMMSEYLAFYGTSSSASAMVVHPSGSYVNLRNGPSQSTGRVLLRVPDGAMVTVLVPGATWSQIKYNGTTGYMMTRFLAD